MSETVAPAAPAAPVAPPAAPAAPAAPAEAAKDPAQTVADSASATPEGGEKKPDTDQEGSEKRTTRRFERRIDKLTKRAAEAQARAEFLEKELQQYKRPPDDPAAPKLENFKDIEEYANAKAKFEADKVLKEHQSKQRTESQKQAEAKLVSDWEQKSARGESKYDDYEDIVGDLKPTTPWAVAIMRAPNGEEIAYHLGKNLKEAQRIAGLEPVDQFLEIGLLSAKLSSEPAKPKAPSKAPPPITPLTGTAPAETGPSDQDDMPTWFKKRQKQVHGSRR